MGRQHSAVPSTRSTRRSTLKRVAISLVAWAFIITGSAGTAAVAATAEPVDGGVFEQLTQIAEPRTEAPDESSDDTSDDAGAGEDLSATDGDGERAAGDDASTNESTSDDAKDGVVAEGGPASEATTLSPPGADIGVLSIPTGTPGTNEAHLRVVAGGDRVGTSSTVTPVDGATFEFFRVSNASTLTGGTSVGTCTTDPGDNGMCGITVPLTSGNNYFYVVQTGAPGPYSLANTWGSATNYVSYNSGAITQGGQASSRVVTMPGTNRTFPSVRANPLIPGQCGLDIALVYDLSNSVTASATLMEQYKAAGVGFVDALEGTPSGVGLYTFGTNAPAQGANNATLPLTSIATTGDPVRARINGLSATPDNAQGGTNWDMGLAQIDAAGFDLVLFLTDGDPTFYRGGQSDGFGNTTNLRKVEEAIHSANKVKAETPLMVVGIGGSVATPAGQQRLSLLSSDYYTESFEQVGELLRQIALENCLGTLTVVKQERGHDGTLTPGQDWTFSSADSDVTPASGETGSDGALNFEVGGFDETTTARDITVTETPQPGFNLEQQQGLNAVCTNTVNGQTVPSTNSGETGFTVSVPYDAAISCQVINAAEPWDELTVSKTAETSYDREYTWEIEKSTSTPELQIPEGETAMAEYEVEVSAVDQIDSNITVSGTISVGNTNPGTISVDLADTLTGASCAIVGGASDRDVPPGGADFDYECTATSIDGVGDTNTATLTWDPADVPGTSGTASATAAVAFGDPETETNRYVTVQDIFDGGDAELLPLPGGVDTLDWLEVKETGPVTLSYSTEIEGIAGECTTFENVASVIGDEDEVLDDDTAEVEVCVGLDLAVEKNVVVSLERTYAYSLEKDVDQTRLNVDPATGEATFNYVVTVTDGAATDSNWVMTGEITVSNPNDWDIDATVTDVASVGFDQECQVTDAEGTIPANGSAQFSYTCTFTEQPEYDGVNTATVTWDEDEYFSPNGSADFEAEFTEADWDLTLHNETVTVIDDQTDPANPVELGQVTWTGEGNTTEFPYSLTLPGVPGDCVEFDNIAWLDELPDIEDDQTVTVCWPLDVSVEKTVDASYDREYFWLLEKAADRTEVTISEGGVAEFDYVVTATPDGFEDSGWAMSGEITVTNPNSADVTVDVSDTPNVPGVTVCTVASPTLVVPAGGEASTAYECAIDIQPGYEGTNTATIAWTDVNGVRQTASTDADVAFEVAGESNKSVEVFDDKVTGVAPGELLGTAEWNAEGEPTEFPYSLEFEGVAGECTEYTNTAVIPDVTDPAEETVTVCVEVAPEVSKTAQASFDREPPRVWWRVLTS